MRIFNNILNTLQIFRLPKLQIISENSTEEDPLVVVAHQKKQVLSWQVPLILESKSGSVSFWKTSRLLCINPIESNNSKTIRNHPIISVSTALPQNVTFYLKLMQEKYIIEPFVSYNVSITPSEPM